MTSVLTDSTQPQLIATALPVSWYWTPALNITMTHGTLSPPLTRQRQLTEVVHCHQLCHTNDFRVTKWAVQWLVLRCPLQQPLPVKTPLCPRPIAKKQIVQHVQYCKKASSHFTLLCYVLHSHWGWCYCTPTSRIKQLLYIHTVNRKKGRQSIFDCNFMHIFIGLQCT